MTKKGCSCSLSHQNDPRHRAYAYDTYAYRIYICVCCISKINIYIYIYVCACFISYINIISCACLCKHHGNVGIHIHTHVVYPHAHAYANNSYSSCWVVGYTCQADEDDYSGKKETNSATPPRSEVSFVKSISHLAPLDPPHRRERLLLPQSIHERLAHDQLDLNDETPT